MEKMSVLAEMPMSYADLLKEFHPTVIHNERENELATELLERLAFKEDLSQAETDLIELLSVLIGDYEKKHHPVAAASPIEVLEELMAANNLKQKDLVDVFGVESTVSAVLSGKRDITRGQIGRLSERFGVSPAVFF
jgi:HTH-type transcriptional regulator/antitoxin HigA